MALPLQTYVYVATAAASLGLSTFDVMNLIDGGVLAHAEVEGIELVDKTSLAAYAETLAVAS